MSVTIEQMMESAKEIEKLFGSMPDLDEVQAKLSRALNLCAADAEAIRAAIIAICKSIPWNAASEENDEIDIPGTSWTLEYIDCEGYVFFSHEDGGSFDPNTASEFALSCWLDDCEAILTGVSAALEAYSAKRTPYVNALKLLTSELSTTV